MHRTDFAGLTSLGPGDPLSTDGYSFQGRNPDIIDHFLKLIVTHRHDAHPALANPATDPTVAVDNAGGTIPADTQVTVGYTLLDQDDGETLLNPVTQVVTTQAGLADPTSMPVLALDNTAGGLLANSYSYGVTVTDGVGGETILGTVASIDVPPGNANSQVHISGLSSIPAEVGGVGWRLWRSVGGDTFALVASSTDGTTDAVTDDGSLPCDCGVSPPSVTGSSKATSRLRVTVPGGQPADAVQFRIYASLDGTFADPCLLGTYPIADQGTEKTYTALAFLAGSPPEVATTVPGSVMIAGGGGGGGTGGTAFTTDDVLQWTDPGDTEPTTQIAGTLEVRSSASTRMTGSTFHAEDRNPAPATFNIGQPPTDTGGVDSYLVAKTGTSEAEFHAAIGLPRPVSGTGYVDGLYLINAAAAGWDLLGVGWGDLRASIGVGVFAIIDRASGELRIVYRVGNGDPLTVLASAAYSGIVDGSLPSIRLERSVPVTGGLTSGFTYHATLTIGGTVVAECQATSNLFNASPLYAQLVAGWTDPTAWQLDSVFETLNGAQRDVLLTLTAIDGTPRTVALLDENGSVDTGQDWTAPTRQKAGAVAADGTSDNALVTKTGVGTYDVLYYGALLDDGEPIIVTDPGGATITNVSPVGFTIDFGADTAFRFIAVSQP